MSHFWGVCTCDCGHLGRGTRVAIARLRITKGHTMKVAANVALFITLMLLLTKTSCAQYIVAHMEAVNTTTESE